jgi:hypothetical protein
VLERVPSWKCRAQFLENKNPLRNGTRAMFPRKRTHLADTPTAPYLIVIALNNALSALTGEPVPNRRHLLQLLFQFEVYRLSRLLTALSGISATYSESFSMSSTYGPARP